MVLQSFPHGVQQYEPSSSTLPSGPVLARKQGDKQPCFNGVTGTLPLLQQWLTRQHASSPRWRCWCCLQLIDVCTAGLWDVTGCVPEAAWPTMTRVEKHVTHVLSNTK